MFPLVEFPELVQHYAGFFRDVFSAEAFIEFERYVSGLIVSENKTVEGMNRWFVNESRNQSSLNRLLTESPFSLEALNAARLNVLESLPETAVKEKGVLSVDDTLLSHYGQHFDQIAYLYDPVEKGFTWAHDLVTLHYSDDETDYPLRFQLWKPADLERLECGLREAGIKVKQSKQSLKETAPDKWRQYLISLWRRKQKQPEVAKLYDSKLKIAQQLLSEWVQAHPHLKLPVAFDNWYTQPDFCHFLDQELGLPYVGTLSAEDQVVLRDGKLRMDQFAQQLKQEHLSAVPKGKVGRFEKIGFGYKGRREHYYSYCHTHRIHNFGRCRLVINYREADLSDTPVFYLCNRLLWQAPGISRIRRHRWPVEVYHEEGKAEGLDQYQLRDFRAIERHIALVATVYSLLRAAQHDPPLSAKLQRQLKIDLEGSPAFWRRTTQAQSLWSLALFITSGLAHGQTLRTLMTPLLHAVCAA
jgi:DDE superfamily endonuclease